MKKLAVVTGARRGLGLAMSRKLVAEGWRVEGWDLQPDCEFTHPDFSVREVNVTEEASVKAAAAATVDAFGVPHALINNAGITRDSLAHKMSVEDFQATLNVNVLGTFLPTQALGGAMRDANSQAQKAGQPVDSRRIVMISSIAGLTGNVGQANYAASKAAVIGFMKSIAKEWGRFNVSAVAVAPGLMKTEMTKTIPEDILKSFVERTPLRRMGEADELAAFVAFLCRPEAAFIHGEAIAFSGGLRL